MNLLITGAWKNAKEYIKKIEDAGHSVEFLQFEKDELPCPYEWVEGVVCNGLFLSHDIKKFKNLKYIQLTSAGFDRVPMDYIKEHDITIYNARGVYSIPMAEFALFGVLELYKRGNVFLQNQRQHLWEKQRGLQELCDKNVCIIGCGNVGTECAKRFCALGCKVVGINRSPRNDDVYEKIFTMDNLKEVLSESDIVILTLPLTDETRYLMDEANLQKLKRGSILVNISRGEVIDTKALIKAMPKLGGAVLDVFEEEPLTKDSPLWNMDHVIITPHNSFEGEWNGKRLANRIFANLPACKYN